MLLVLHGLFGSQSNWGWHSKQLAQHFQVYGLDLRNHGDSPHDDNLDYPAMAADVQAFMHEKGIQQCHLLGHSMGGKVGMQLALAALELLDSLTVVDIAPVDYGSKADGHLQVIAGMRALALASIKSRSEADKQLSAYIADEGMRQFVLTNLQKDVQSGYRWRLNLDAIENNYDRLCEAPEVVAPFNKPTLFIKGAESDYITADHGSKIKTLFPMSEVKIIMGAGHWVHAEKPQTVQKVVNDFLAKSYA